MAPGIFTSTEGKSDDPNDEKNGGSNPQKMHCESCAEENQDEKQCENQHHRNNLLIDC
jgi:hypothetical protein